MISLLVFLRKAVGLIIYQLNQLQCITLSFFLRSGKSDFSSILIIYMGLGCSARSKICILPKFWVSDAHEVTKGSLGEVTILHFTTVLSVRHARSDERVARSGQEFPFYHSFERPTRTKWRKGRSVRSRICMLPQFWASDTHEVTRGLSNPQVRSLRPDRKRIYFKTFSEDFD